MNDLERLHKLKDKAHERNGDIIDMMNDGKLSISDAKMMLQINSEEIERLNELINMELIKPKL